MAARGKVGFSFGDETSVDTNNTADSFDTPKGEDLELSLLDDDSPMAPIVPSLRSLNSVPLSKSGRSMKPSEIEVKKACDGLDDRMVSPGDFEVDRTLIRELVDMINDLMRTRCMLEKFEKMKSGEEFVDCGPDRGCVKAKDIDYDKHIAAQYNKLVHRIPMIVEKFAEICDSFAEKYRNRLCRTIGRLNKYQCKNLVPAMSLITSAVNIDVLIEQINALRMFQNEMGEETTSVSLFDGACCDGLDGKRSGKGKNSRTCELECDQAKNAIIDHVLDKMDPQDFDYNGMSCKNYLRSLVTQHNNAANFADGIKQRLQKLEDKEGKNLAKRTSANNKNLAQLDLFTPPLSTTANPLKIVLNTDVTDEYLEGHASILKQKTTCVSSMNSMSAQEREKRLEDRSQKANESKRIQEFKKGFLRKFSDLKGVESFVRQKMGVFFPCQFYAVQKKVHKTLMMYDCLFKMIKYLNAIFILEEVAHDLRKDVAGTSQGKLITLEKYLRYKIDIIQGSTSITDPDIVNGPTKIIAVPWKAIRDGGNLVAGAYTSYVYVFIMLYANGDKKWQIAARFANNADQCPTDVTHIGFNQWLNWPHDNVRNIGHPISLSPSTLEIIGWINSTQYNAWFKDIHAEFDTMINRAEANSLDSTGTHDLPANIWTDLTTKVRPFVNALNKKAKKNQLLLGDVSSMRLQLGGKLLESCMDCNMVKQTQNAHFNDSQGGMSFGQEKPMGFGQAFVKGLFGV